MRVLVFLSFILAIVFMLDLDVVLWIENPLYGIGGIVGFVAYFIVTLVASGVLSAIFS